MRLSPACWKSSCNGIARKPIRTLGGTSQRNRAMPEPGPVASHSRKHRSCRSAARSAIVRFDFGKRQALPRLRPPTPAPRVPHHLHPRNLRGRRHIARTDMHAQDRHEMRSGSRIDDNAKRASGSTRAPRRCVGKASWVDASENHKRANAAAMPRPCGRPAAWRASLVGDRAPERRLPAIT
jgi:hypothetical protein